MSEVNPPLVIEGGSHDSDLLRQLWGDTYTAGIVAAGHLEVTEQATPALGVTVAAGRAFVDGNEASDQGVYYVSNDADHDVALATADATNDRIDLIVARILDSFYSGASDEWELQAVTGTPAASPSAPSAPSNSLVLAEVTVPADAGGNPAITDSDIDDTRSEATLLDRLGHGWQDWSPTYSGITVGSGTVVARYVQQGKTVHFYFKFILAADSSVGTPATVSAPVEAASTYQTADGAVGPSHFDESGGSGYQGIWRFESSTTMRPLSDSSGQDGGITLNAPFTWGTGDSLVLSGTYEAA